MTSTCLENFDKRWIEGTRSSTAIVLSIVLEHIKQNWYKVTVKDINDMT